MSRIRSAVVPRARLRRPGGPPSSVRPLLWVRALNQVGAYTLPILAVLAGPAHAPLVLAAFGTGTLVSRWLGAWLASWLATRTVITTGLVATGISMIPLALASGTAQVAGAAALVGLAFEIYEPATYEALAQSATGEARERAYTDLSSVLVAAGAVSGAMMSFLLPLGPRWLIAADAVSCLAAAGIAWSSLTPGPPPVRRPRRRAGWRPVPQLVALTLASTAFAVGYLSVILFAPLVLLQRGASAWVPGAVLGLSAAATPLLSRTRWLGRHSSSTTLTAGSALLAVGAFAMACMTGVLGPAAAYIAWSTASAHVLGHWSSRIAEVAPAQDRPRWFAFQGSSWAIAQVLVPVAVGALDMNAHGAKPSALVVATLAFSLSCAALLAIRRSRSTEGTPAASGAS